VDHTRLPQGETAGAKANVAAYRLTNFARAMAKNFLLENRSILRQAIASIYGC
jgi:hypothetical protein